MNTYLSQNTILKVKRMFSIFPKLEMDEIVFFEWLLKKDEEVLCCNNLMVQKQTLFDNPLYL